MKRPVLPAVITALFALILTGCNSEEYDKVSIDLSDTGQPIEKYIYGQFIEHLGRCIYGGIWAEMVEDRKFYYPVKEDFDPFGTATDPFWGTGPYQYLKASPWEIIGKGEYVRMEREDPYTGEFAVRIQPPGDGTAAGIRQYGLGLIKGKKQPCLWSYDFPREKITLKYRWRR
jgi:alpha-N-arabinofuranosidase